MQRLESVIVKLVTVATIVKKPAVGHFGGRTAYLIVHVAMVTATSRRENVTCVTPGIWETIVISHVRQINMDPGADMTASVKMELIATQQQGTVTVLPVSMVTIIFHI